VWRRAGDLGVLGALGFTPGQRRRRLAWQAVALAAVAAVFLILAVGRLLRVE